MNEGKIMLIDAKFCLITETHSSFDIVAFSSDRHDIGIT